MKYFYKIFSGFFLVIQSFLILKTPINIFPEVFFSSWLVSKGLIPYRDFFEHHGFLLYYILAPLSLIKSLILMKIFFFMLQSLNLFFLLKILRKLNDKMVFLFCGFLYVLMNYIFTESNLRYETVIITLYLLVYFILISENIKYKYYLLGIIISLSSFIKITAGLIIIPILLLTRNIKVIISYLLFWGFAILYFLINKSLNQFIDGILFFNKYLANHYTFPIIIPKRLLSPALFIIVLSIFMMLHEGKIKKILSPLLFLIFSLIFLFSGFGLFYYIPIITFIVILIASTISNIKIKLFKGILISFITIYIFFLLRETKYHLKIYSQRIPWIENTYSKDIIVELNKFRIKNKQIYIFGNEVEIYYFLNQLPPTYFTSFFNPFKNYYNFEDRVISEIKKRKIGYIIKTKPMLKYIDDYPKLNKFIETNYSPVVTKEYQIYILKN